MSERPAGPITSMRLAPGWPLYRVGLDGSAPQRMVNVRLPRWMDPGPDGAPCRPWLWIVLVGMVLAGCGGGEKMAAPPPPATRLAFTLEPANATAGRALAALHVTIEDSSGAPVSGATNAVTLAIGTNAGGGTLSGTTTVDATNGVAVFGDLSIQKTGSGYTLVASSGTLTGATSAPFAILPAAPAQLAFTGQPSTTQGEQPITPAVRVAIEDSFANTVTNATNAVTLALGANPGGGTLGGTTTASPVSGVTTFAHLSIDRPGTGYTLVATASGLTGASSAAFDIRLTFTVVNAANVHTCAVTTPGAAYCWGWNGDGELGNGTTTNSAMPAAVSGGLTLAVVSGGYATGAGGQHTCGVTTAGAAYCWGYNGVGELGNGTTTNIETPAAVSGGLTFTAVSAGGGHTCGVTAAGAAYCWGDNSAGQLGNGTTTSSSTPVPVSGGLTFAAVSAGKHLHTCGITTGGAAYCWGHNSAGELGNGTTTNSSAPVAVSGGLTFAAVSAGSYHTCGVTTAGAAYCWGDNSAGELGNGTIAGSTTPVAVSGGLVFASLSTGGFHACGMTSAGIAYCWGWNVDGQLGSGTTTNSMTPVAVSGGLTFAAVSAGNLHTCAMTAGGMGYCWGDNPYGELGNGATGTSTVPVRVVQ